MSKFLDDINNYYTEKIRSHGATSKGVDWNGEESQFLRFYQLSKIYLDDKDRISQASLIDLGCGYGAYLEFLTEIKEVFDYYGVDISKDMISQAQLKYPDFYFSESLKDIPVCDYLLASGIFNVKQDAEKNEWLEFIYSTLTEMNNSCKKGFSFNLLTSYSDKGFMRDYLYYANPLDIFDYCKKNFSKNVALLHDYNLYEFTILVRK